MTEIKKFIDHVDTMHRQNLNGREDFIEAFQLGINAAYEEREELVKQSDVRERLNDFLSKQQDIPEEVQKVINEKFWDLI